MTTRNGAVAQRGLAPVAGVLLALAGLWPVVAQAQTTFVSTLDDPRGQHAQWVGVGRRAAQPFRTGSTASGYLLHSVAVRFDNKGISTFGTLVVTLRESAPNGEPGAVLHTLATTSSLELHGVNEFTAPAGIVLAPDTRYLVHLDLSNSGNVPVRWLEARSGADQNGWEIPGSAYEMEGGTESWSSINRALTMAVKATEVPVTLHLSADSIGEDGGTSTVTASLSQPLNEETTVTVSAAPVAPATANDYTLSGSELTIAAGDTTSTGTVTITAADNAVYEGDKQVTVSATATNSQGTTDLRAVTLTIEEDEEAPELSIEDTSVSVDEGDQGGTTLQFTVKLDDPTSTAAGAVTVDWETADGTATAGRDYRAGNGSLTFNSGETSKTVTVTVTDDNVHEPDETFTVALSNPSGAIIGDGTGTATVTIRDDDDEPTATLHLSRDSIGENGETSTVTARLSHPSSETTTVTVSVAPVAPAVSGDYTLDTNRLLTIRAGATRSTGTVRITAVNNAVDAPDKALTVSGEATNAQGVADPVPVTLTLRDNDTTPTVTLHLSPASVTEAGGESTVTARLSHPSSEATTVTVSAAPVAPAVAGDYTLSGSRLTIAAGETTSTGTVTVTAVDNEEVVAADKAVTVSGTATNPQRVTGPDDVTLAIWDDDVPGLSIDDVSVAEGDAGDSVTLAFTVTLNPAAVSPVMVDWATADVTATAGTDYTARSGRLTFGTGEDRKTVTVRVTGDEVDEPDETFTVTLSNPSGTSLGRARGTGTIEDDDEAPTGITLSVTPAVVSEGAGETTVAVTATVEGGTRFGVAQTLAVSVTGSGESRAVDFEPVADFEVVVPAGSKSGKGTFELIPEDDERNELDETVTVSGGCLREAGTDGECMQGFKVESTQVTVTDDDKLSLSVRDVTVREDAGEAVFVLTLSHPSERTIEVATAFMDGTATSGVDYRRPNEGPVVFAGGETEGELHVALVDDSELEGDETFTVGFDPGEGSAEPSEVSATCTILDDELAGERERRLGYALATFGRTVAQELVTAIEDRPESAAAGTTAMVAGTPLGSFRSEEGVYEALRRHVGPDGELVGTAAFGELLSRSHFQLSLSGEGAGETGGGAGAAVLWGRGSRSWSEGRLDPVGATRGEVLSGQLGLEFRVREDTSLGVMLSGSAGEVEFDGELDTEVETELVGVHPYVHWTPRRGLRTWAMLGYGAGEATLRDRFTARTGSGIGTDLDMKMAAAGGSHEVASLWGIDWSVGTSGFHVRLDADEVDERALPALSSEVWQWRLLLEGSTGEDIGGASGLSGTVELAARVDGGDAESGVGMELGGGVGYGRPDLGIEVEARGRVLLSHEEEGLEEAGVSLALAVDPGERGRGVYFALAPTWGTPASGARAMWEGRRTSAGGSLGPDGEERFEPKMRLSSELGYTAPAPAWRGTLTTYGAFSTGGGAARQYRVGRRLELGIASMSLEAERRESAGATPEHGIRLRGGIRF